MYAICVLCVRADSTDTTFIVHVRRPLDLRGQRSKPLLVVTRKMFRTQHWTYCVSDNLHAVDARVEDSLRKNCLHAWSDLAQPDISAQS
eukprot:COSAG01_NODE_7304_length_3260_cov_7.615628_5_plen_89_part_00